MPKRIVICAAQVPFERGGAEILVESLRDELVRRGHQVEIVCLPFRWYPKPEVISKIVALLQKITRRLLRWYIDPIVEQQNAFNLAVLQTLQQMFCLTNGFNTWNSGKALARRRTTSSL